MTTPSSPAGPGGSNPPELRASDADRDQAAYVLREAAGEGRLTLEELDQRLNAVYSARTYAELEPITRDLPRPGGMTEQAPAASRLIGRRDDGAPSWRTGIAIMSGFTRAGAWLVPKTFTAFAFWGGGKLDLREASFAQPTVRIWAFAIMGGIEVIAPDDIAVHVNGIGIMGGFDDHASGPGAPGAPRVIVSGFSFWGGVDVKRKARKEAKRLRKKSDDD